MSFFRKKFTLGDSVFFTFGNSTVRSGIVQAQFSDGDLAIELDESSYPYDRGHVLRVQRYNTTMKENGK